MIHCDDTQTLNRVDINNLNTAVTTLAEALTSIFALVESQQELIRMLDMRVTELEDVA